VWLCGVRAADLTKLIGIDDVDALKEKRFRDRKLAFYAFPKKLVPNVQLCRKNLDRPRDLGRAPHGARVQRRHVELSL